MLDDRLVPPFLVLTATEATSHSDSGLGSEVRGALLSFTA